MIATSMLIHTAMFAFKRPAGRALSQERLLYLPASATSTAACSADTSDQVAAQEDLVTIPVVIIPNHAPATNQIKHLRTLLSHLIFGLCRKRAVNLNPRRDQGTQTIRIGRQVIRREMRIPAHHLGRFPTP
jgi:hypothetical protein